MTERHVIRRGGSRVDDPFENAGKIVDHLVIGETDDLYAPFGQEVASRCVVALLG